MRQMLLSEDGDMASDQRCGCSQPVLARGSHFARRTNFSRGKLTCLPSKGASASISLVSVGSSSRLPVRFTRRDTGHMRNLSSAADRSNSIPPVR
jgi:hypothetical protein